ncbi:MAG: hypothetical protein COV55_02680 [Candidatus Komeilibacteria bacterium CG11_big_fil_rev_8_21_14_0_20_36_20]|uniref:Transcription regulator TrmB N-terminal domain-containing protein n=1 Tax=Candidatus Komeilibacteria bacterium CG11_big_fil_rev_8_21_14_0_20_36_20 TaxID=1974477 RepID=A0A2H0NCY4_9BACT|nr:MAG: hypothetical protein COV55_02680 [Candidatus Komeilibacteria bacterium CG11_big_fil_rev_8_21_14_0_20_36_20]PIR81492.1 MAG: hypothetical protein COU21_03230 [Candidatus Komeilibacteria bacterium CG10_big_fil_rev_8_21_14_0_10_36_65]
MIREIKNNLGELDFNSSEIKVYMALTHLGEAKASEIAKKADLPRTTAISILNKLKEENYITTHQYHGTIYYWIESPKVIANVFNYKIDIAHQLSELLTNLYRDEVHFPTAQIYDTKSGIKKFIEKTLTNLDKKSIIYTIDMPKAGNYAKIFSDNAEGNIMKVKGKRDLITHTLIPFDSFKKIDSYKIKNQNIKIREMPKEIKFEASLWIIKDFIVHFSGNPPFLITVKHKKIVSGIKCLFNFLWNISEPKN